MQKRTSILPIGLFFLIISIVFFSLHQQRFVFLTLETVVQPLQKMVYSTVMHFGGFKKGEKQKEKEIDKVLLVSHQAVVGREMQALRDQFETTNPSSQQLLPAHVIGLVGYIPGISRPTGMIVDKGETDKVVSGLAVVYKNNLVGQVTRVTKRRSEIALLTKNDLSFTGKTLKDNVNGLVRIESSEIFFKNVLLSDKIVKTDIVVTKGDQDVSGKGFPPDIVVGKITAIDKKPSALFQSAKLESFLDPLILNTVFIFLSG